MDTLHSVFSFDPLKNLSPIFISMPIQLKSYHSFQPNPTNIPNFQLSPTKLCCTVKKKKFLYAMIEMEVKTM